MGRLMAMVLPLLLITGAQAQASTIQVTSALVLGANDYFDWGQLRVLDTNGDAVGQASPLNVTSNLARTGSVANGGSVTGLVEGTDWFGDFTIGDRVLFSGDAADPFGASSSFTMNFTTAVAGVGLQIGSNFNGPFTANLEVFNGATSLGSFNVAGVVDGAEDGSAPFLGALSDAANINVAVFSLTTNTGAGFGVNRLLTTDTAPNAPTTVPEPASLLLLGTGVMGLAVRRARRKERLHS